MAKHKDKYKYAPNNALPPKKVVGKPSTVFVPGYTKPPTPQPDGSWTSEGFWDSQLTMKESDAYIAELTRLTQWEADKERPAEEFGNNPRTGQGDVHELYLRRWVKSRSKDSSLNPCYLWEASDDHIINRLTYFEKEFFEREAMANTLHPVSLHDVFHGPPKSLPHMTKAYLPYLHELRRRGLTVPDAFWAKATRYKLVIT